MEFDKLTNRAMALRRQYENKEKELYGEPFTGEAIAQGFAGDANNIVKLVQAAQGKRDIANSREQLAALLSHSLWSVIILSKMNGIDLEQSYFEAMDRLETHLLEAE
jgi:NTP pyrophosphatase (non-canonical NTP hydrolase)